jgi:hypothetical protein
MHSIQDNISTIKCPDFISPHGILAIEVYRFSKPYAFSAMLFKSIRPSDGHTGVMFEFNEKEFQFNVAVGSPRCMPKDFDSYMYPRIVECHRKINALVKKYNIKELLDADFYFILFSVFSTDKKKSATYNGIDYRAL